MLLHGVQGWGSLMVEQWAPPKGPVALSGSLWLKGQNSSGRLGSWRAKWKNCWGPRQQAGAEFENVEVTSPRSSVFFIFDSGSLPLIQLPLISWDSSYFILVPSNSPVFSPFPFQSPGRDSRQRSPASSLSRAERSGRRDSPLATQIGHPGSAAGSALSGNG